MNHQLLNIAAIIILMLINNLYCQSKPLKSGKVTPSKEVIISVKNKSESHKIEIEKPKRQKEITNRKSRPNPKFARAPQRPMKHANLQPVRREVANFPTDPIKCRFTSGNHYYVDNDYIYYDGIIDDFEYDEQPEDYMLFVKTINDKEFTDEDFPICIKEINFKYLKYQWIDSDDFPEFVFRNNFGVCHIYNFNLSVYVIEQNYDLPFAALITFPDYSTQLVIFNLEAEFLQADSIYSFNTEIPLVKIGCAWITLGYYDFEYEQFYSAAFSPYLTKQKIFIP